MNWIILITAGFFEIAFTFCLGKVKIVSGNVIYLWYAAFLFSCAASMLLLIKASKNIPLGTAYAVWTGIGAAGTVLIGIFVFKDPATFWKMFFIVTLIGSIIGLKIVSN